MFPLSLYPASLFPPSLYPEHGANAEPVLLGPFLGAQDTALPALDPLGAAQSSATGYASVQDTASPVINPFGGRQN